MPLSPEDTKIAECKLYFHIDAGLKELKEQLRITLDGIADCWVFNVDTGKMEKISTENTIVEHIKTLIELRQLEICKAFGVTPDQIGLKL